MKNYCFLVFVLALFIYSCKKDLSRPDPINTSVGKDSNLVKVIEDNIGENNISRFACFKIAFAYPVDSVFTSKEGYEMILTVSKNVTCTKDGKSINLSGQWEWNKQKDTMSYVITKFPLNAQVKLSVTTRFGYKDETDYQNNQYINISKTYNIQPELIIKASDPDTLKDISPTTMNISLTSNKKFNIEQNAYNRTLRYSIKSISIQDTVTKDSLPIRYGIITNSVNISFTKPIPNYAVMKLQMLVNVSSYNNGEWEVIDTITNTKIYKVGLLGINAQNIASYYPLNMQYNFLKSEYTSGYLQLNGSCDLNNDNNYNLIARFTKNKGDSIDVALNYDKTKNCFTFQIPQNLENRTIYHLRLIANKNNIDCIFHDIYFRTSAFNAFAEKFANLNLSAGKVTLDYSSRDYGATRNSLMVHFVPEKEGLDEFESSILVKLSVSYSNLNSDYYRTEIIPFYKCMDSTGFKLTWRTIDPIGYPPVNCVSFSKKYSFSKLTETQIENNQAPDYPSEGSIDYAVNYYGKKDSYDIRKQCDISGLETKNIIEFSSNYYPNYSYNCSYVFTLKYLLPDKKTKTFEQNVTFILK